MRRIVGAVVVTAVLCLGSGCGAGTPATLDTGSLTTSTLEQVRPPDAPPEPRFTRTTYAAGPLEEATAALDRCRGPVAIDLGADRPVLVAEHDYCGGAAWISRLDAGDALDLDGAGVEAGTYVVTGTQVERRGEAQVKDLPAADVVLQTCISPSQVVLVAANRFEPSVPG